MRRLFALAAAILATATIASGCGSHTATAAPAAKVPLDIVPPTLPGPAGDPPMTLAEYKQGAERLDAAGGRSVIADGRVFEIRRGTTLVGALQVSTLIPRIDVSSPKQRDHLANLMVSGSVQKVSVSGVEVVVAKTTDKLVFVWFGDHLFEVLQIKGIGIDPPTILKGIIDFQRPTGRLRIGPGASK